MAWVTEYDMTWRSNGASGKIELQRDGGSYQQGLNLVRESLQLRSKLPSWEDPIWRYNCSFTVINDLADFYELIPLMTISTGQVRCLVTMSSPESVTLFDGYLNSETINQNMINKAPISFTASGLIQKLQYDTPVSIETLQNLSLIDIIDNCLTMTGSSYPIRVHCSLYEENATIDSYRTLFNRIGVLTEMFWKNNVDLMPALEILTSILTSVNCYLYWYQDYWYIEHYEDLGEGGIYPNQKHIVEYTSGVSYGFADIGSDDDFTTYVPNIHAPTLRPQMNTSQLLSVAPGMKIIEVRKEQKQFFNLFNGDLSGLVQNDNDVTANYPDLRTWHGYRPGDDAMWWSNMGESFKKITNAVLRNGFLTDAADGVYNGITTRFRITNQTDTQLTISFSLGVPLNGPPDATPADSFWDKPEDYIIYIFWFLKNGQDDYVEKLDSANDWTHQVSSGSIVGNSMTISGVEVDEELRTYEGSINIPIGEIFETSSGYSEDLDLTFRLGHEVFSNTDAGGSLVHAGTSIWFGDLRAVISEEPDSNLIKGTINTDFLEKKTIEMDLYDTLSWSYRNTLLWGAGFVYKTALWFYDGATSLGDTLARQLMISKFRLHNVARQLIKVEYHTVAFLFRPLTMWLDNKQSNKKFVMTEDIYKPELDSHTVTLREYDNETPIDLV